MLQTLDLNTYVAALEDFVARHAPLYPCAAPSYDLALVTLAKANVAARKAKEEADRLAGESAGARAAWIACRTDTSDEDPYPSDVLPAIESIMGELSVRSANVLRENMVTTHSLLNLVVKPEEEVAAWRHGGIKTLNELREVLQVCRLRFGMTCEEAETAYRKLYGD